MTPHLSDQKVAEYLANSGGFHEYVEVDGKMVAIGPALAEEVLRLRAALNISHDDVGRIIFEAIRQPVFWGIDGRTRACFDAAKAVRAELKRRAG